LNIYEARSVGVGMSQDTPAAASSEANFAAADAMVRAGLALQVRERLKTLGPVTVEHRREGQEAVQECFSDLTGATVHVLAEMRRGSMRRKLGAELLVSVNPLLHNGGARQVLMHRRLAVVEERLTWVEGGTP